VASGDRKITFAFGCGDGKHIVYATAQDSAYTIWRMDADGSNPVQLTHQRPAILPLCSSDGMSVLFDYLDAFKTWRMGIDGTNPTELPLPNQSSPFAFLSRDNKLVLYREGHPDSPQARDKIMAVPVGGGPPVFSFDIPLGAIVGQGVPLWSPDGHGVDFTLSRNGASNVWRQPVPSGTLKQITNFPNGFIRSFVWSPDGKILFLARGSVTSDIILLKSGKN
jgi:Tol biopolymer transport system component